MPFRPAFPLGLLLGQSDGKACLAWRSFVLPISKCRLNSERLPVVHSMSFHPLPMSAVRRESLLLRMHTAGA